MEGHKRYDLFVHNCESAAFRLCYETEEGRHEVSPQVSSSLFRKNEYNDEPQYDPLAFDAIDDTVESGHTSRGRCMCFLARVKTETCCTTAALKSKSIHVHFPLRQFVQVPGDSV